MKQSFPRALFSFVLLSLSLVVAGCGGGGGGGSGSGSGSGASTPASGDLTLSQNSLSFVGYAAQDSTPSQTVSVSVTFSNTYKVGVYAPNVSQLTWLGVTIDQTSNTSFNFTFYGKPSAVGPGNYSVAAVIRAYDSGGTILGAKDITISLQVKPSLSVEAGVVLFNSIYGAAAPTPNSVSISGTGLTWTATADQPWINLGNASGSGNGSLSISVAPAGLAPGVHNGSVTVQSSDITQSATIQVSYTVTLPSLSYQASALDFQGVYGETLSSKTLSLSVNGSQGWTYSATASNPWITVSQGSGGSAGSFSIGIDSDNEPANFSPQSGSITFVATLNGVTLSTTVPVTLTVSRPVLIVNSTQLNFSGLNGSLFAPQAITINISNHRQLSWVASSSASWLVVSSANTSIPGVINIGVDPGAALLASGIYQGQVQIDVNSFGVVVSTTINVSLNLTRATITIDRQSVTLGGEDGHDLTPQSIKLMSDTGTISYPWTATVTNAPWLQLSAQSGTVAMGGATLQLTPVRGTRLGGTYTGNVHITVAMNGDSFQFDVPVTLNLDAHRLLLSTAGVALTSTSNLSRLTASIAVTDNYDKTTGWTATSDQSWLTVTPSGTAPGNLVLTANPAGLGTDTIYYATVTLASQDSSLESIDTVRVGLWVGNGIVASETTMSSAYTAITADPIRPYVYFNNGGTGIDVFNVYTAAFVTSIPGVAAQLGDMAVSRDGRTLYALDKTNYVVVPIDLQTYAIKPSWAMQLPVDELYIDTGRTNGKSVVVLSDSTVRDASTGVKLTVGAVSENFHSIIVKVSSQGNELCGLNQNSSPYGVVCSDFKYTSVKSGTVVLGNIKSSIFGVGSFGRALAINPDGSRVYVAAQYPSTFSVYDVTSAVDPLNMPLIQSLPGGAVLNSTVVGVDGRFYGGSTNVNATQWDTWVYDSAGFLQANFRIGTDNLPLQTRGLAVSGDGMRLIGISSIPSVKFLTVGP